MSHQHMIVDAGAATLPRQRGGSQLETHELLNRARGSPLVAPSSQAPLCMARCDTLDFAKILTKRSPRQPGMARPAQKLLLWAA